MKVTTPKVSCVMLTDGREKMAAQAIHCFESRTYENAELVIYDTGCTGIAHSIVHLSSSITMFQCGGDRGKTVGALRNLANACATGDILCHWDSDDVSHSERIAEQVKLLTSTVADVVGFNQVLFWDSTRCMIEVDPKIKRGEGVLGTVRSVGEAWLYTSNDTHYAVGGSLAYWRRAWQLRPFADLPKPNGGTPEDNVFVRGLRCIGVNSLATAADHPRLICRIHGANTSDYKTVIDAAKRRQSHSWTRMEHWDDYCRSQLA